MDLVIQPRYGRVRHKLLLVLLLRMEAVPHLGLRRLLLILRLHMLSLLRREAVRLRHLLGIHAIHTGTGCEGRRLAVGHLVLESRVGRRRNGGRHAATDGLELRVHWKSRGGRTSPVAQV